MLQELAVAGYTKVTGNHWYAVGLSHHPTSYSLLIYLASVELPIAGKDGKVIGLRLGQTASWARVSEGVATATEVLNQCLRRRAREHRRGHFACLKHGFSYGNGQTVSLNLLLINFIMF